MKQAVSKLNYANQYQRVLARLFDSLIFFIFFLTSTFFTVIFLMNVIFPGLQAQSIKLNNYIFSQINETSNSNLLSQIENIVDCKNIPNELIEACGDNQKYQLFLITISLSIATFCSILYFTLLPLTKLQGTIGKYLLNIKIVSDDGKNISFVQSFTREIFWSLQSILMIVSLWVSAFSLVRTGILYLILFSLFYLPFTKQKQMIYDMLAQTLVLKRD